MVDVPAQAAALRWDDLASWMPGAVIVVDLRSRILSRSDGAHRLYGWTAAEAVGRSIRELILAGAEVRADEVAAATHAGDGWSGEFTVRHALPDLPGLTVAHRYLPGTEGAEVGGDWYDLIALTGGRVGLVIGDVMGRGARAAAVMGQLRAAVRACALVEDSPSAVLSRVDAMMSSLGQTSLTTCLYGVYDPVARRLVLASAGHLPPLLVHRDGGGQYAELDPGPPLGVTWAAPTEVTVDVPDGAVLLLYTDGLVEGRAQPVESGMLALRNTVASVPVRQRSAVEGLCDALLRALGRDGRPDDDSALMGVWTGTSVAPTGDAVHLHLAGHLSEVSRARRLTVQAAAAAGVDTDDAALLVTELASNALRHGGPGVDLWIRRTASGGLRVELVDGHASSLPVVGAPGPDAEGGRGLLIVSVLARAWGTEQLAAGKCVWFELAPAGAPV